MKQTRRTFLQWLMGLSQFNVLVSFFTQGKLRAATPDGKGGPDGEQRDLRFLISGDWGRDGQFHQTDVATQMGLAAAARKCRLIISVGDNFYDKGVQTATDSQWKSSFEEIYTASSLAVPWYAILGNHDYKGRPGAQLDYAKTHPNWKMPARYFSAVEPLTQTENVAFSFLDMRPFVAASRTTDQSFKPGAASKLRPPGPAQGSRFYKGTPGFMAVSLGVEKMHVDIVDFTGSLLYQAEVKNRVAAGV